MELRFFVGLVTPLIQFRRVISLGMVESSCSQSSKRPFSGLLCDTTWVVLTAPVFPPILR